jgi:DNA repair exonuclease SbcCD ATPase subunit
MNLCPLCKSQHNKTHNILNEDKIDYICNKHNEPLINYCNRCKKNICFLCGEEHKEHEIISLGKMMVNKNDLNIKLEELKKSLNIFEDNINKIMEILNKVKENIENYYRLEEYIFNNYDKNKRNYEILYNINELINYNKVVIKDINSINNKNDIENKFISILNLYNQINKNEIKLTLNIKYENINKEVYFLDNTDGEVFINSRDKEEHHHDFLKELNESNVELYIDNKKYKYNLINYFLKN